MDTDLQSRRNAIGVGRPEHVHPHHVLLRVVKEQRDDLEWNNGRKAPGEIPKQRGQVAVRRDRLGHFEEQTQLISGPGELPAIEGLVHDNGHMPVGLRPWVAARFDHTAPPPSWYTAFIF